MDRNVWLVAMACAATVCMAVTAGAQGTPYLVKDIEQRPGTGSVAVRSIGAVGERVFFAGNDAVHGFELWTSDGSEDGTKLVRDIQPGPRGAVIADFTAVGDAVFFVVDDGVHGRELWTSDGTEAGTHLVRDIAPGRSEGLPHLLTPFGDLLFFVADDGTHGDELWVTDGSEAGTALVADVRSGAGGARIRELVVAGGLVWFVANDGVHGSEPWSSDGTPEGTLLVGDLRPGADGSQPADLVRLGDGVLFAADDGATGSELWSADAASGASRVADILPGRAGSEPSRLVVAGDRVYFTATTSTVDGAQLWATDGTGVGTYRVSDIKGQWAGLGLTLELTAAIGDTLYFVTQTDDGRGAALWRTDGTADGTELVKDLKTYPCSAEFRAMVAMGDRLMLVARSYDSDDELWTSDGTESGTELVKDIFPGQPGGRPGSLAVAGDVLFFAALDGLHGRELWKSDGTEEGTALVRDILLGGSDHGVERYARLVTVGDEVLFSALGGIWKSDGTSARTTPLGPSANLAVTRVFANEDVPVLYATDLGPAQHQGLWRYDGTTLEQAADLGTEGARISDVAPLGGDVVYGVIDPSFDGGQLLRTVAGGTTPVLLRSFSSWLPGWPFRVRGSLYFNAGDWQTGSELWKTDGTPDGTVIVADINPGPQSAVFNGGLVGNVGRRILISADDGVHGDELFVTDGTPTGTRLLRDIAPGPTSSWPTTPGGRLAGVVYFGAQDASGQELWRSDGTADGTFRVKDIVPGPDHSAPYGFVRLGDVLLFSAYQPATGLELWRTDGTTDGTWLVADVQPGRGYDGIHPIVVVGDVAYFVVEMPNHARQLWLTDGTPAGTRLAADVSAGGPGAGVMNVENRNGQLFFVANDSVHGDELWALTCGNGVLDELEACDDGAHNGSPTSCCTGTCAIRPGAGDACDPIEGRLVVRRARVQYDGPSPGHTGRIAADGQLDADGTLPLSLAAGLVAFVGDGAAFTQRIDWPAAGCATQSNGVLRCSRPGAVAVFRPVAGGAAGAQRYRFTLNVSGLAIDGPLAPSLDLRLRTGGSVDRAGGIADCVARAGALVCRP